MWMAIVPDAGLAVPAMSAASMAARIEQVFALPEAHAAAGVAGAVSVVVSTVKLIAGVPRSGS
jgi:hypothetical protein